MKRNNITGVNSGNNYCWFYLHTNGSLISKPKEYNYRDFEGSDFVKCYWKVDLENRADAYNLLCSALLAGANQTEVDTIAAKWNMNDHDAQIFIEKAGLDSQIDGDQWCVHAKDFINLQESWAGFGTTIFEALCDYHKNLQTEPAH